MHGPFSLITDLLVSSASVKIILVHVTPRGLPSSA